MSIMTGNNAEALDGPSYMCHVFLFFLFPLLFAPSAKRLKFKPITLLRTHLESNWVNELPHLPIEMEQRQDMLWNDLLFSPGDTGKSFATGKIHQLVIKRSRKFGQGPKCGLLDRSSAVAPSCASILAQPRCKALSRATDISHKRAKHATKAPRKKDASTSFQVLNVIMQ